MALEGAFMFPGDFFLAAGIKAVLNLASHVQTNPNPRPGHVQTSGFICLGTDSQWVADTHFLGTRPF